jgi:hypothetical protein
VREVQQIINDLYGQGVRRCNMMQSFVTDDLESARDTMLKHYQTITIKRMPHNALRHLVEVAPTLLLADEVRCGERGGGGGGGGVGCVVVLVVLVVVLVVY